MMQKIGLVEKPINQNIFNNLQTCKQSKKDVEYATWFFKPKIHENFKSSLDFHEQRKCNSSWIKNTTTQQEWNLQGLTNRFNKISCICP